MNRSGVAWLLALALTQCAQAEGPEAAPSATASSTAAPAPKPSAAAPAASAATSAPAPATAFEHELDALDAMARIGDVTLSADGTKLAWVESATARGSDQTTSSVRYLDRKDGAAKPRSITAGASAHREHALAWSPDGTALAFVSDAQGKDKPQLYLATPGAAQPRKLTDLKGALDEPRWSPDGKSIAILFAENAANLGPVEAVLPAQGDVDAHSPVQRVVLVDAATGDVHPLTRPDLYVYEHAWSPDGSRIAILGAAPPGDRHWYVARLAVVDAHTGEERTVPTATTQKADLRWSPDGKSIAFIGGLMSDEGSTGGDVFVVPADGSAPPRDWTPSFHGSASSLAWPRGPAGDRIVFGSIVDGRSVLQAVDAAGKIEPIEPARDESLGVPALSADGAELAVVHESFTSPPELWAGPIGKGVQVTHANEALTPRWGAARSVGWKSDGVNVQGWLVAPGGSTVDPLRPAPLVVVVHGGPAAAMTPRFGSFSALAGEGYFVFSPNPRGSFGQGEAFTAANVKDFGHGDMRDILAGVDEVLRTAPVDATRLGLYGWSYGGFMTMWMVTQTTRFRAAVAGAGIANWQSYWGENAISDWMLPYFGATVYDDPKVYARSSPIEFIKQARTPTLVLVGEHDGECPAPQSFEFWRGLQAQGVETKLIVYPGEGHGFRKPEHRRDRMRRILRWFDSHLGADAAK